MRALQRKLWRELWTTKWQALAIVLVMMAGMSTMTMSISTLLSLEETRSQFYFDTRFADLFIHLKRAPTSALARVREIPGVSGLEGRVAVSATIDIPGLSEPATARVLSIPDRRESEVSRLYLRSGRMLEPNERDGVLVSEAFASAHELKSGDEIKIVLNGRERKLRVVGVALSPEFVYSVRPGELLPDDKLFGILWMSHEQLSAAFDLKGAFNDLAVKLMPGANEAAIKERLDELLAPYGGTNSYGRDQQPSHRFLNNELIQLRTMAVLPPTIFLSVTIFLLNMVLARQVATQREQIAAMRAFGLEKSEIAIHFLSFAMFIGFCGAILGTIAGGMLGKYLTILYTQFFRFPVLHYELDWRLVLMLTLGALGIVAAGVWSTVWGAAGEPPAQAMQPEAPPKYRPSIVESLGIQKFLPVSLRMVIRHLERRPFRSLLSSIGISFSMAILVMGNFMQDALDHVLSFQFYDAQRYDLMISFVEPLSSRSIDDLKQLTGVQVVEPFRVVPTEMIHSQFKRRIELMGLPEKCQLMRVVDDKQGEIRLPREGLIVSKRLAEVLHCEIGDQVEIQILEGTRRKVNLPIVGTVEDYFDLRAYLHFDTLRTLLREEVTLSGALLAIDEKHEDQLYRELKKAPLVGGVNIKRAAIESYEKTLAENLLRMKFFNVLFASIVAFGVVYNCARISLAERSRELATMRVLGFTRAETSTVLLGELAILVLIALPIGSLLGYGLAKLVTSGLDTEVHRFPLIVQARTYAFAAVVVVIATLFSSLVVRKRMDHFDLVSVLKVRE